MSAWSFFPSSNCFTFCFRLSHFNLCLQASFCTPPPYTENFCTFARADFLGNSVGKKIPYLSCQSCWMVWDVDLIVLLQATQGYVGWWAEGVGDEGEFFSSLCASLAVYGCSLQYCWGTPILSARTDHHHFAVSDTATYPKISTDALNQRASSCRAWWPSHGHMLRVQVWLPHTSVSEGGPVPGPLLRWFLLPPVRATYGQAWHGHQCLCNPGGCSSCHAGLLEQPHKYQHRQGLATHLENGANCLLCLGVWGCDIWDSNESHMAMCTSFSLLKHIKGTKCKVCSSGTTLAYI